MMKLRIKTARTMPAKRNVAPSVCSRYRAAGTPKTLNAGRSLANQPLSVSTSVSFMLNTIDVTHVMIKAINTTTAKLFAIGCFIKMAIIDSFKTDEICRIVLFGMLS